MPAPLDIPPIFTEAGGYVLGCILLLVLLGLLFGAYTFFRRRLRHCRIAQRNEGWGSRKHPNQEIDDHPPEVPALEVAKRFVSPPAAQAQLPQVPENGGGSAILENPDRDPAQPTE